MDFQVYDIAIVPVILALVQFAKQVGMPNKLAPVLSLALGIASGFVYLSPGDPAKAVFVGIVMGLSAVGLWSGAKNSIQ